MAKDFSKYIKKGMISEADIEFLASFDPSKTKKYLPFIIKAYLEGENLDCLRNRIGEYDILLRRNLVGRKDINSFKTFGAFDEYVQQCNNIRSRREERQEAKSEAEVILDNDDLFIVCPHSHEASCLYGAGTKWCITAHNGVHFLSYYYEYLVTFYFIQVRSHVIKSRLEQNLWKLAVVVYRDGRRIEIYDAIDNLVAGNIRSQRFVPPGELFYELGVDESLFVPRGMDERMANVFIFQRGESELDLSRSGITKVPDEIGSMTDLKNLTLSENKIESLPEAIGSLSNLRTLHLFHNRLNSLPDSLYTMKQLQWLGLTGNPLNSRTLKDLKSALPDTRIYFEKRKAA